MLAWERGEAATRHTPELELTLYRLVQEALTNAVKHARARTIRIDITERDDCVELSVSDDDRGFEPDAPRKGFGLTGMRERVALADGELEIESGPTGTTVRARLPARRADLPAEPLGRDEAVL